MPHDITLKFTITDELCGDLLTTCVECGSRYWLACETYTRAAPVGDSIVANVDKIIGCIHAETGEPFEQFAKARIKKPTANFATMLRGLELILSGKTQINSTTVSNLLKAVTDPESCEWDADDADAVLQAGLFGEIVYG